MRCSTESGKLWLSIGTAPHCGRAQAIVDARQQVYMQRIYLNEQSDGKLAGRIMAIGCSNEDCGKHTVWFELGEATSAGGGDWRFVDPQNQIFDQRIYPAGAAKPQPEYIPEPIRNDYVEACLIRDLSPKASATLVRRCLQGMIRDFAGISQATLFAEIETLRKAVDDRTSPETVTHDHIEAIDAVRGIGNIGAHMEKDINVIVDVEPGEAQLLINLVEMLFEEWYVQRHKRQERLGQIQTLAAEKKAQIAAWKELGEPTNAADETKA